MDIVLEVLDWAKDKDVSEIYYEDRSSNTPTVIHLAFQQTSAKNHSRGRLSYLHSPAIGKLALVPNKIKVGYAVTAGDILGHVEANEEKVEIRCSLAGKVLEVVVPDGSPVSFGDPIVVLEVAG